MLVKNIPLEFVAHKSFHRVTAKIIKASSDDSIFKFKPGLDSDGAWIASASELELLEAKLTLSKVDQTKEC